MIRITISSSCGMPDICGEIVGVNMGHVIIADEHISKIDSCVPCEIAAQYGAIIVGGRICDGRTELKILVSSMYQLSRILREMYNRGLQPKVLGRAKYIREPSLTEEQLRLVELAYRLGYYDDSRKVTIKEIASMLGTSPSAADRKLRRALRKIVEYYLSRHGRGDYQ